MFYNGFRYLPVANASIDWLSTNRLVGCWPAVIQWKLSMYQSVLTGGLCTQHGVSNIPVYLCMITG